MSVRNKKIQVVPGFEESSVFFDKALLYAVWFGCLLDAGNFSAD